MSWPTAALNGFHRARPAHLTLDSAPVGSRASRQFPHPLSALPVSYFFSRRQFGLPWLCHFGLPLLPLFAAAAPVESTHSPWSVRVWQSDDGLPNNQVQGLTQTP